MGPHVVDFHRSILEVALLIRNAICRKMPRGFRPISCAAKNGVGFPLRQVSTVSAVLSSDLWRSASESIFYPPLMDLWQSVDRPDGWRSSAGTFRGLPG